MKRLPKCENCGLTEEEHSRIGYCPDDSNGRMFEAVQILLEEGPRVSPPKEMKDAIKKPGGIQERRFDCKVE